MPAEVLELLAVREGGRYVDGTVGAGGHARMICAGMGSSGRLLGLDVDAAALAEAGRRLEEWRRQVTLVRENFAEIGQVAQRLGFRPVDGVLLDLGPSSMQLDDARRGFSFMRKGPLDMRMDARSGRTAAQIVNEASEEELVRLLREYGEERAARRIARAIVRERERAPIEDTPRLAEIVVRARGGRRGRTHPATNVFRALRMAVNDEAANLERGLEGALEVLAGGGRLVVISFQSFEDRMVKDCFRAHAGRWESLQGGGRRRIVKEPEVRILTRRPLRPGADEVRSNPRARSALVRAVERVA